MISFHERHISQPDATRLAFVIDARMLTHPAERDDLEELADALSTARVLPEDLVPQDSAALGARVDLRTSHGNSANTSSIVLVEPAHAEPARGRISVVSPLGRTLLGLRTGATARLALPGGREVDVEVLGVARAGTAQGGGEVVS